MPAAPAPRRPPHLTAGERRRPLARWLPRVAGLLLLCAVAVLTWLYVQGAPGVPFSDEAGHLAAASEVRADLERARTPAARLHVLAAPRGSYPGLLSALAQLTMPLVAGIDSVRAAAGSLVVLHALVALRVGPGLWGGPATWAYVALACGGPLLLSLSTFAFLDGPTAALCGMSVLLLLASDGFRRPGAAVAFGLAATAALYTKWVALVFLAPPVAWEVGRAVLHSSRRWSWRAALAGGLLALAAGLATAVWLAGTDRATEQALRDVLQPWTFLSGPAVALGLLAGLLLATVPASRRPPPALVAAVVLTSIVLAAGPWYAGAWSDLLGRLDHEAAMLSARSVRDNLTLRQLFYDLGDLAPPQLLVLAPGLLLALRRPVVLGRALAVLAGGALGAWLVARVLPPDLRYLLPAVPLVAAAGALGLGTVPRWLVAPLAAVVLAVQLGLSAKGHGPPELGVTAASPEGAAVQRRLGQPWPPLPVGRLGTPDPLPDAEIDRLLAALSEVGLGRRGAGSLVVYQSEAQPVQGRAVRALGLHAGLFVHTVDARWAEPLEPVAAEQYLLAAACGDELEPLATFETRPPLCPLGLYRGEVPSPRGRLMRPPGE